MKYFVSRLRAVAPLVAALLVGLSVEAAPRAEPVAGLVLGETTVAPHVKLEGTKAIQRQFRKLLRRELRKMNLQAHEAFTLSAAIVQLQSQRQGDQVEVECIVSANLRQTQSGALRALLRGKGRVQTEAFDAESRILALETAVHGVLRQVPTAIAE